MSTSMNGRTVLIAGGTGGIGRATAIGLASMGARVGITAATGPGPSGPPPRSPASRATPRWTSSWPTCRRRPRSGAQATGKIDFDDLMGERKYSGSRAYDRSKLANVMFTYELARRLEGTGVTATALHPGLTNTAFSGEDPARAVPPIVALLRPFMRSPERGAVTSVYLASSPEVEGVSGKYFANRKEKTFNKSSYDSATTTRLWQISADLVGLPVDARH